MKRLLPLNHKYSVGSGVFAGIDESISMGLDENGRYVYQTGKDLDPKIIKRLNRVDSMSDYSADEDELGKSLFGGIEGVKHNNIIGYYTDLYAGYVNEYDFRKNATSGGFGTWLLCELLNTGEIDKVIHVRAVDPGENNGILFKYEITDTLEGIKSGAKARYYPMELSQVLKEVKSTPGRYAVVGISDFITELRLLCSQEDVFRERIVYMIGLFNAHQKSTKYAESMAWQYGIQPGDLTSFDFRVKNPSNMAWNYQCSFSGVKNGKEESFTEDMANFPMQYWNMGYFKSKFSDFTDNAFNELADVTLGDAWLHEYAQDSKGTNIIVVRNPKIASIIKTAMDAGRVTLDELGEEKVIASQGILSHLIYELPYRLYKQGRKSGFVPIKRTPASMNISFLRRRVQDLREFVSDRNDTIYRKALNRGDFEIYRSFVNKYNKINDKLYKLMSYRSKFTINRIKLKAKKSLLAVLPLGRLRVSVRGLWVTVRVKYRRTADKNKNVGAILSLSDDFNYGNVMQRYALQKFLSNNNLRFTQLSMYTKYLQSVRDQKLSNSLHDFVDRNIESISFKNANTTDYSNYIVGSDQVWRNHGTDDIDHDYLPYWFKFLGDADVNRISYAASFGVDNLAEAQIDESLTDKIRPLLGKFSAVSVRERAGESMVDEIAGYGYGAKTVLDPTLLLGKKDYSRLVDSTGADTDDTEGVFSYILDIDKQKRSIIEAVAGQYGVGYKIVTVDPDTNPTTVEGWLKGFRDADCVVTDSFHGAVFSIINETDFIILANRGRGLSRVENLLDMAGISKDRLVFIDSKEPFDYGKITPIDWRSVKSNVSRKRKDSAEWLLSNIEV